MKLVILDRDGTIIKEPPDKQIDSLEKLEFVPGVISGMNLLYSAGYTLIIASNQDGLGSDGYPEKSYQIVQDKLLSLLEGEGIEFDEVFVCPHKPEDNCKCRKPKTGLVDTYIGNIKPDIDNSFVIGDRASDIEFGKALGFRTALLGSDKSSNPDFNSEYFPDICRWILDTSRSSVVSRKTEETSIEIELCLDGKGNNKISTGIRYFDHMLEQVSKHSGISLNIKAEGDTDIDEHHTVEDTGLALGEALSKAIGDKRGIERFAFAVPMDEASADVLLDLSGRSHLEFDGHFEREMVGELPTELVEDFFKALSDTLNCTLHIKVTGRNDHHKIESIFKAVGRVLKDAVKINIIEIDRIPSTKGTL